MVFWSVTSIETCILKLVYLLGCIAPNTSRLGCQRQVINLVLRHIVI